MLLGILTRILSRPSYSKVSTIGSRVVGRAKKVVHAKETNATRKTSSATQGRPAGTPDADQGTIDRRGGDRRRSDRRQQSVPVAVERRKSERRKVQRRRQIDPTTCERDYHVEEVEFMNALDQYKRTSGRMFPTCSEVLEVLRSLGYEKRPKIEVVSEPVVAEASPLVPEVPALVATAG